MGLRFKVLKALMSSYRSFGSFSFLRLCLLFVCQRASCLCSYPNEGVQKLVAHFLGAPINKHDISALGIYTGTDPTLRRHTAAAFRTGILSRNLCAL